MNYAASALATFDNMLGTLDHLASKAQAADMSDDLLGSAKLADDMFPLETQFRIAVNQVILALGRIFATEIPLDETAYGSFAMVRERLAAIRAEVIKAGTAQAASADTPVDYTLPNDMRFVMSAEDYLRDWTMPNFYFHTAMAYALLRHQGLSLGKSNFLPHMMRHAQPAEATTPVLV